MAMEQETLQRLRKCELDRIEDMRKALVALAASGSAPTHAVNTRLKRLAVYKARLTGRPIEMQETRIPDVPQSTAFIRRRERRRPGRST